MINDWLIRAVTAAGCGKRYRRSSLVSSALSSILALTGSMPKCNSRSRLLPSCFPGWTMKLTATTIPTITLPEGKDDHIEWDDELIGFAHRLRRRRTGPPGRSYVAQYRVNGRTRRHTWPADKLTPAQAREAARQVLAQAALGQDPQAEKAAKRRRAEHTFRSVVTAYLAAKQSEWRPQSYRISKLYLTGTYFRPLHSLGLNEILHPDIAARLSAITRNRSSVTAAAARRSISALYRWAMEEGWATSNPVVGTRKPAEPPAGDHVLTDAELVAVWNACPADTDFGRIIRLLILLGSRRNEVGRLRWSELDLENGTWTLPASRSKNRRAVTVVLPPLALAIIKSVPRRDGRDPLFGSRAEGFTLWEQAKHELDQRTAGTVRPFKVHDLRRTTATGLASLGIEPHVIEAVLNHFSGHRAGVHGIYNRSPYTNAVKTALLRWSEHVIALVEGRPSDNVVTLQRA